MFSWPKLNDFFPVISGARSSRTTKPPPSLLSGALRSAEEPREAARRTARPRFVPGPWQGLACAGRRPGPLNALAFRDCSEAFHVRKRQRIKTYADFKKLETHTS